MKKHGHLNRDIARVLASMGHTDSLVIADCGLPIPVGVECIDLSLSLGEPGFMVVLDSILADMQVEKAVLAQEMQQHNLAVFHAIQPRIAQSIAVEWVRHDTLKQLCSHTKAVIRTGENTPYANIVLYSGVIF